LDLPLPVARGNHRGGLRWLQTRRRHNDARGPECFAVGFARGGHALIETHLQPSSFWQIHIVAHPSCNEMLPWLHETLSITWDGISLKISWPEPGEGWVLESTSALSGPAFNWASVAQSYQDDGTNIFVTVPALSGASFYRLHKL
jgi:hypothetical protein